MVVHNGRWAAWMHYALVRMGMQQWWRTITITVSRDFVPVIISPIFQSITSLYSLIFLSHLKGSWLMRHCPVTAESTQTFLVYFTRKLNNDQSKSTGRWWSLSQKKGIQSTLFIPCWPWVCFLVRKVHHPFCEAVILPSNMFRLFF